MGGAHGEVGGTPIVASHGGVLEGRGGGAGRGHHAHSARKRKTKGFHPNEAMRAIWKRAQRRAWLEAAAWNEAGLLGKKPEKPRSAVALSETAHVTVSDPWADTAMPRIIKDACLVVG